MPIKYLDIETKSRIEAIEITDKVKSLVKQTGLVSGICTVYIPHTTAGIFINEHADPNVVADILENLDRLIPRSGSYHHTEGNADSHIKTAIVGNSVAVPFENGSLILGMWQGIFLAEFDGPRRRRAAVQIIGT